MVCIIIVSMMSSPVQKDLSAAGSTVELECKKICILRCVYAVGYSVAAQFLLLTTFLLFVNFSLRHPIDWITSSFSVIFSIYTWLYIMPLISLIIVYGVYLGKLYLTEWATYERRFLQIYKTAVLRHLFMLLHILIGYLTTWLYSTFLSKDLQRLTVGADQCAASNATATVCINDRYLLLIIYGITVAISYYVKKFPSSISCQFELIHQHKYLKIKTQLYSILSKTVLRSFLPVCAAFIAYNFGGQFILKCLLNNIFSTNVALNTSIKIYDFKLVYQIWILSAYIWCNLDSLNYLFEVFLAEPRQFPIEHSSILGATGLRCSNEVTLVEALSNTKVPILRQLAAQDLFSLACNNRTVSRRQQIYTLSNPGGHPYNWNALSAQCFILINAYNDDLTKAINAIATCDSEPPKAKVLGHAPLTFQRSFMDPITSAFSTSSPKTATEMAEKIRHRQIMESTHMRNMISPKPPSTEYNGAPSVVDPSVYINTAITKLEGRIKVLKRAILNLPGIHYLFAVNPTARLYSLLTPAKAQEIAWIAQGIGAIATHSIREDRFGVVQTNLPTLIHSLLHLKITVDRIPNLNRSTPVGADIQQQSTDSQHYYNRVLYIRNALKRTLYDISITFAEYLPNLIKDADDLELIQCFINFKEA